MLRRVVLRDASSSSWLEFITPAEVLVARCSQEVTEVLDGVSAHCASGGWAAGYLAYEAGAGLDPALVAVPLTEVPLAVFGLYADVQRTMCVPAIAGIPCTREAEHTGGRWKLDEPYHRYREKVAAIHTAIDRGAVYQVNYTIRFRGSEVEPAWLMARAARSAPYGAWLELDEAVIVSASPELFFRLNGAEILSSPMKGTAGRCADPADDIRRKRWLQSSAKNRAENLMITDMVRNDLGRIAEVGSVRAHSLFEVQALPTVWQMTSTVSARTRASLTDIFRALFPAASITGAPKIAAASMIRKLEESSRGIYTGAIGYVGPARDGIQAQFSVAIRTAWIRKDPKTAIYGVGGGIVWDSRPEEEYAEARMKARILEPVPEHTDSI